MKYLLNLLPTEMSNFNNRRHLTWLFIASSIILFFMLGSRELWTQESRWAAICFEMIKRGDFFHPYLLNDQYYDKPLLSYWIIIAISKITNGLSEWSLRLPSAFSAILTLICTYRLGEKFYDKKVGLIASWMLISTYFFIFWSRTASADMLNVAGILLATMWYFEHKLKPTFLNYATFFVILAITSLFKGLVGAIIPLLIVAVDVLLNKEWRSHLKLSLLAGLIPGVLIYLMPFLLSDYIDHKHYTDNGLYQVFRENFLRYLIPFDHKKPFYVYLYYLPAYIFPWSIFLIQSITSTVREWKKLESAKRVIPWCCLIIFTFFTISGSRRSYYILPLLPFVTLFIASWIAADDKRIRKSKYIFVFSFSLLLLWFVILQPIQNSKGGMRQFSSEVKSRASKNEDWSKWQIVMRGSYLKVPFYFRPAKEIHIVDDLKLGELNKNKKTIFITTQKNNIINKELAKNYFRVDEMPRRGELIYNNDKNLIAYILREA